MKRLYIITGAKGHLAGTIIRYLRKTDCHIRGMILPTENGEDDRQIAYYRGDVTKPETLDAIFAGTECNEVIVIHTAGIISIADQVTPQLYAVNVEGTKNVIRQCVRHHVKRLVYVSSVHAIPGTDGNKIVSETEAFSAEKVAGAYAKTKAEATRAVLEAAGKGLDAVVVHPSGIIGPYDNGNNHMIQMINMYLKGKLPAGVIGGYDFTDVRDVAKGCLQAVEKGCAGNCYILSNRYITIREILDDIRQTAGGRGKICLPMGLARIAAPFFEWQAKVTHTRPLYTRYALDTLSENAQFSHNKATAELGYVPRDLGETVRDTVLWLKGADVPLERL